MRGLGTVYQRGQVWWIRYSLHGKEHRESSHSADKEVAMRLLARRLADGPLTRLSEDKIPFDDVAADYIQDRELHGAKGRHLQWSKVRVANLKTFFGGMRAVDISTASMREYARKRLALEAAPGTINRDFAALSRIFTLALQAGKLSRRPHIPRLREAHPRQGFLEPADYQAICQNLPPRFRDVLAFAYLSGWRRGEILTLEWADVDRGGNVIRLRPEVSKNRTGRTLVLSAPLQELIERRWRSRALGETRVFHEAARMLDPARSLGDRRMICRALLAGCVLALSLAGPAPAASVQSLANVGGSLNAGNVSSTNPGTQPRMIPLTMGRLSFLEQRRRMQRLVDSEASRLPALR